MSSFKDTNSFLISYGVYGGIGIQLALSVVGGTLLGLWADGKWGIAPWGVVTGVVLGTAGGFYNLIRILTWHTERKKK